MRGASSTRCSSTGNATAVPARARPRPAAKTRDSTTHGSQKLFGWFGGHGLEGTGGFLHSLGYRPGKPFAALGGATELVGGLCLALGLLTPLAAIAIIAMMFSAAMSVHIGNGLWITAN